MIDNSQQQNILSWIIYYATLVTGWLADSLINNEWPNRIINHSWNIDIIWLIKLWFMRYVKAKWIRHHCRGRVIKRGGVAGQIIRLLLFEFYYYFATKWATVGFSLWIFGVICRIAICSFSFIIAGTSWLFFSDSPSLKFSGFLIDLKRYFAGEILLRAFWVIDLFMDFLFFRASTMERGVSRFYSVGPSFLTVSALILCCEFYFRGRFTEVFCMSICSLEVEPTWMVALVLIFLGLYSISWELLACIWKGTIASLFSSNFLLF